MNRTGRTFLNALIGMIQLVATSLLSLFVNRLILSKLGSDFNGVNATVAQSLAILGLLEGGFTMASLVALYKPYTQSNYSEVNVILSTTRQAFNRVGKLTFLAGLIISLTYPFFIKTGISYITLVLVFLLSVIPLSYSFSCVLKYRLIFQAAQQEYVVVAIQLISTTASQLISLAVLKYCPNIVLLRAINVVMILFSGLAIKYAARKSFRFLDFAKPTDSSLIKGTKDVFIGNVTGYLYSSSTVLFISTFVGTVTTSIYAVYNSVISIVLNTIYVILRAPQSALGQVIAEHNSDKTKTVFELFEYITILSVCIVFSITYSLIVPFVRIYTSSAKDGNYSNEFFAVMLILTSAFELIHIPSGLCINLHGDFKAVRNIQLSSCGLIIVTSLIGAFVWGTNGIIGSRLLTAVYLSFIEIYYVRKHTLNSSFHPLLKMLATNVALAAVISVVLKALISNRIANLRMFLLYGVCISLTVFALFMFANWLILPQRMRDISDRARPLLERFLKRSAK